jgi:hypothetical protein
LGQVLKLDQEMDKRGYLRLMTTQPFTMNLSNTLDVPKVKNNQDLLKTRLKRQRSFFEIPVIRKVMMKIYNKIFKIYYKERTD